jgi:hypothetical protein
MSTFPAPISARNRTMTNETSKGNTVIDKIHGLRLSLQALPLLKQNHRVRLLNRLVWDQ